MKQRLVQFNFQLPLEILEELREESRKIGISVSDIIKFRIAQGRRNNFLVQKKHNPGNENYLFSGTQKREGLPLEY